MNTENVRAGARVNPRVLAALFVLALLIGACGNGGTPNYGGGGGGGGGGASPTVPPDAPRNVK